MKRSVIIAVLTLVPGLTFAGPQDWPRPLARAADGALAGTIAVNAPPLRPTTQRLLELAASRPEVRPTSAQQVAFVSRPSDTALLGPVETARPFERPPGIVEKAMAKRRELERGAVCGDIDIQGDVVGSVPGRIPACGITDAVRVRSVSGVRLSVGSLMNCRTAKALKTWVDKGIQPAFKANGGVSELRVVAHFACRTRNNRPGAKISEHGKGNAIDIAGFTLGDGTQVSLLQGWRGKHSKALRSIHRAACGPFGTVLGPNSDRFHQDHFHVDTARHRGGPFCR